MKYLKVIISSLALASVAAKNCGVGIGKCKGDLCCSKYGYCGKTEAYCGTGCQSEFGKCGTTTKKIRTTTKVIKTTTKKNTTIKKGTRTSNKKTTTSTVIPTKISTNGKCGPKYGVCPSNRCCSKYGYCGTTSAFCGTGCQSEFGKCSSTSTNTTTTTNSKKNASTRAVVTPSNKKIPFKFYYECKNKKQWALTFDDGPYKFDESLLDLLKKYNVKATFFLNGNNVMDITSSKGEKIVKRMYNEGHVIGSHTWKHADLNTLSASGIEEQMTKLEDVLVKYIGKKPAFMRLPYGSGTGNSTVKKTLEKLGYTAGFMWNVDTKDWKYTGNVDYALARFKEKLGKPILSLNHCFYENITEKTLLTLIEKEIVYMKKQGYTLVTADECVGLPPYR